MSDVNGRRGEENVLLKGLVCVLTGHDSQVVYELREGESGSVVVGRRSR